MNAALLSLTHRFARRRIFWSRLILISTLVFAVFADRPALLASLSREAVELPGYVLLCAATLWRVWCLVFIGGSKNDVLSRSGPYSIVRNPLYVGHFVGVIGFGLALGHPLLAAGLAIAFGLLYPAVVEQEERRLLERFGDAFADYLAHVPRWIPNWRLYDEPPVLLVSPAKIRQGIFDAMWYLWAFLFVVVLELVHDHQLVRLLS